MKTPEQDKTASDGRSEAARLMGSITSERKAEAARENGKKGGRKPGVPMTEEHKAAIQAARKAQEDARKQDARPAVVEKKRVGRPRTRPVVEADAPTRGRGRPKKQDALATTQTATSAENGTGEAGEA